MEPRERNVRVNVQARNFRYEGDVVVPTGGYRSRLLDLMNTNTEFLALTDVLVRRAGEEATGDPVKYDVLLIRKGEIEFVVPLEDAW
jgi:hypothetical protein